MEGLLGYECRAETANPRLEACSVGRVLARWTGTTHRSFLWMCGDEVSEVAVVRERADQRRRARPFMAMR